MRLKAQLTSGPKGALSIASLRNWRGLRGRMVLYFSLASFAAALALSIVTYASTRAYLLDQRTEVATR